MKKLAPLGLALLLAACAGTDNSPVPNPLTEVKNGVPFDLAWKASYSGSKLYRFAPDTTGDAVYMAGPEGVAGYALADGHELLKIHSDKALAGGIGTESGTLMVGTLKGEVLAYDAAGKLKWSSQVSSEVIAPPVLDEGVGIVRTVDGRVWGLDLADGKVRWQFQRPQPALILRNYAPVTVADGAVYVGLAGGRLAALAVKDGHLLWESQVAQPKGATELERTTDVTSAPVVSRGVVCAVAFQGKVACFAAGAGSLIWSRDISSYVGLAMDADRVYVTDEVGNIQAFDRDGGRNLWKFTDLYGRRVSAPTVWNGQVAVGDYEGYIHLLAPADGHIVARQSTDKSRILVTPRVVGERLLVQTEGGGLYSFATK